MHNWFGIVTSCITIASLTGVVLNIKRKQACFIIWAFTNASWMLVDLYKGVYAQAFLFLIYFILSIWGIVEWRSGKEK